MARRRNVIIRALGLIVALAGLQKTVWVVYNVFFDPQPAFIDSGVHSAGASLILGVLLVMLGGLLIAWYKPMEHHQLDADGFTPGIEKTVRELLSEDRREEAVEAYCAATGTERSAAETAVSRLDKTG